jgi:hypothetical protein
MKEISNNELDSTANKTPLLEKPSDRSGQMDENVHTVDTTHQSRGAMRRIEFIEIHEQPWFPEKREVPRGPHNPYTNRRNPGR